MELIKDKAAIAAYVFNGTIPTTGSEVVRMDLVTATELPIVVFAAFSFSISESGVVTLDEAVAATSEVYNGFRTADHLNLIASSGGIKATIPASALTLSQTEIASGQSVELEPFTVAF